MISSGLTWGSSTTSLLLISPGPRVLYYDVSMYDIHHLLKVLWVCCPRHIGVRGNNRADGQAGKATIPGGLRLRGSKMSGSLRHYHRAQNQGHHNSDRLEVRGDDRENTSRPPLKWRKRIVSNETNVRTVSEATLGKRARCGEVRMSFHGCDRMKMVIWHIKTSTQNLACSQRQIHTVQACRFSQAKSDQKKHSYQ